MDLSELQAAVAAKRRERGFVTDPVKLCVLLAEEVGELARLLKRTWSPNYPTPTTDEYAAECADVFVVLAAIARELQVDLDRAVAAKFFGADEGRARPTAQGD